MITQSLLLTARQAAELLGISVRTWRTWDAGGLVPRAIQIGHTKRWRADELRRWIADGCPARHAWKAATPTGQLSA